MTQIKQADVVLLGFPLLWSMPDDIRANDLDHYARVTDPFGPAMTWSMYSIGWLDVGDKVKAEEMFNKSYQNYVTQPFKVLLMLKHKLIKCIKMPVLRLLY